MFDALAEAAGKAPSERTVIFFIVLFCAGLAALLIILGRR